MKKSRFLLPIGVALSVLLVGGAVWAASVLLSVTSTGGVITVPPAEVKSVTATVPAFTSVSTVAGGFTSTASSTIHNSGNVVLTGLTVTSATTVPQGGGTVAVVITDVPATLAVGADAVVTFTATGTGLTTSISLAGLVYDIAAD